MKFSRRGDGVTADERALVAEASAEHLTDIRAVWLHLAHRIGIDSLAVVFDEFGSEKIHVPTRAAFFAALYQRQRDAEILRRLANGDPPHQVARDFELTTRAVQYLATRNTQDAVSQATVVDRAP